MRKLEEIERELERSGKAEALRALAGTAEAQSLGTLIDRTAVEKAVKGGDTEALQRLLGGLLATPEGQRMAEKLRRMMETK